MPDAMQDLRDAAGNGAVHPAVTEAIEYLNLRLQALETPPADDVPATDTPTGGE